jgi:hypothetical protein
MYSLSEITYPRALNAEEVGCSAENFLEIGNNSLTKPYLQAGHKF